MKQLNSLLVLCLLATPAVAQDLVGSYDLDGRYSTRRGTEATLTVNRTADGLQVSRTARFTGWRFRNDPSFTWTSTAVTQRGRLLSVIYTLDKDGASSGLIHRLDPSANPSSSDLRDERKVSVLRAVYRLAADDTTLDEVILNTTRRSSEGWWYWIRTSGSRAATAPTTPPGFVDGFRQRGITDPSLYYHFGISPRSLPGMTDREFLDRLRQNPLDVTLGRVSLIRSYIWSNSLSYRVDTNGRIPDGNGKWRVGQVTDASDGVTYDVIHWEDVDDNSFSFYWKDGALYSIYYEN